jgi:DUF971 family protein
MSGRHAPAPVPVGITVHQHSRVLELRYEGGETLRLPFELMRVYSPSAEVVGHGPGQETLQTGKRDVVIERVGLVGHYALQPHFSDGHDSGLYSWEYLYHLGTQQERLWREYEERLRRAGVDRDAPMPSLAGGCAGHAKT